LQKEHKEKIIEQLGECLLDKKLEKMKIGMTWDMVIV